MPTDPPLDLLPSSIPRRAADEPALAPTQGDIGALDLAAIRRVCEQASPRFILTFWPLPVPRYGIARPPKAPHLSIGEPLSEADIDFCVQARTVLPQLLARVEEAKALIDTLAEYCCSAAPRQDHDEMMA